MINKKYLLLAGFSLMLSQQLFAQESPAEDNKNKSANTPPPPPTTSMQWSNRDMTYRGKNYDVLDSSYYPKFRRKQFHKFVDHQEIFPPKPRNRWEVGLGVGLYNVIGNVPTLMPWQKFSGGVSASVRKSLGYIFSLRTQFIYGAAKNIDRQATVSYDAPYTRYGYEPLYYANPPSTYPSAVYRSTRTEASQLSLDLMFNAYNINFHHARNSISFFGFVGMGGLAYVTRINALDGSYAPYDYSKIVTNPGDKPKKVLKALKKGMDKTYESAADNPGRTHLRGETVDFAPSIGAGIQYKLNKDFNLQVEERYTFPADRYLDGSPFGTALGNTVSVGRANESINYFSIGVNYNLKNKKKSVEPLYWINPLDHAYSELSYPRHMILPNPVLPDEDGDGVTDQFDKCPKTPKNVAVDSHGCPLDTDGDGVPDYKDKQLITPTECQPVDADGVGKCPCPDACKDMNNGGKNGPCGSVGSGTLLFTNATHISTGMEAQLAVLAAQMQANPNCKVVILGGGSGSKIKEQHSWDHVNAVIDYMSEKNNISRDRFIFKYGEAGDENIVTYRSANVDESGASNVPPPHPEIK